MWRDLELGAPQFAAAGMACLNATRVALLGTLRRDGAPRISPVEPYLVADQLLIGAMAWSRKVDDLRHDARCVLHSAVTGPDNGEAEFKLSGIAIEAAADLRAATSDAWWSSWPADKAVVLSVHIDRAVLIRWAMDEGLMTVLRWSPRHGYSQDSRSYP